MANGAPGTPPDDEAAPRPGATQAEPAGPSIDVTLPMDDQDHLRAALPWEVASAAPQAVPTDATTAPVTRWPEPPALVGMPSGVAADLPPVWAVAPPARGSAPSAAAYDPLDFGFVAPPAERPVEPEVDGPPEPLAAGTDVSATLEETLGHGRNVVWCVTLQLAWDELARRCSSPVAFEPRVAEPHASLARHRAAALGRRRLAGAVDAPSVVVAVASRPADLAAIGEEVVAKFGRPPALLPRTLRPREGVVFTMLQKSLVFDPPLRTGTMRFRGHEVACFGDGSPDGGSGCADPRIRALHDAEGGRECVLELETASPHDRLIVAQLPPGPTLEATIAEVFRRCAGELPRVEIRSLRIPTLRLEVEHRFREFQGAVVHNAVPEPLELGEVAQQIALSLDHRGARVTSQAAIPVLALSRPPPPRHYRFDRPFLVLLLRREAVGPYFAAWVENLDWLTAAS
ncbi:MAG: hypothetical protein FJ096_05320 [Deltaproteobacteria bacterium]|nr:hypothetical protein [Deltaproteobacteria bacterium]